MKLQEFSDILRKVRADLELTRGIHPEILRVDELDDTIHVVVPDRADKSLCLGSGGRVTAVISKQLDRNLSIHTEDEIMLLETKLRRTASRIEELLPACSSQQQEFLRFLLEVIENKMGHPIGLTRLPKEVKMEAQVAVAYSGGADSSAVLALLSKVGIRPHAITANPGFEILSPHLKNKIVENCDKLGICHQFIEVDESIELVISRAKDGRIHPCGQCHEQLLSAVGNKSHREKYDLLLTGEMLPSGRQSMIVSNGLLVIHLPAALALTKFHTRKICESVGILPDSITFGCHLLSGIHIRGWKIVGPSIFRVLRELETGVLTTGQALTLVKAIIKPILKLKVKSNEE